MLPSRSPVRTCICKDVKRQIQRAEMECWCWVFLLTREPGHKNIVQTLAWAQFEPVKMDFFSPGCCVEAVGRREVHKCWGQITTPLSVCNCCLRQLSSQPVLSLSTPRDHSAVLSWGFRKLLASDFTLELSDAAAQPRLPKHLNVYKSIYCIQTDRSRRSS